MDAIVNAANERLAAGRGLCAAVDDGARPELAAEHAGSVPVRPIRRPRRTGTTAEEPTGLSAQKLTDLESVVVDNTYWVVSNSVSAFTIRLCLDSNQSNHSTAF